MANSQTASASTSTKEYKAYRNFNNFVAEARLQHCELKASSDGEFLCVTAISNLADDTDGVAIRFTSNAAGMLKLFKSSALMPGRRVHVTGSVAGFSSHYADENGSLVALARPRLNLHGVSVRLGAKPKSATSA